MTQNAYVSHLSDRCAGVLLATACGDALGAPHEFGSPLPEHEPLAMTGGGAFGWAAGEFTDDTAMAVPIAQAAAAGKDLRDPEVIAGILSSWLDWLEVTKDVGVQTGSILRKLRAGGEITEQAARALSQQHHEANDHRSGGNGALMRTAPVALAYLNDPQGLTEAARRIAELTHWEESAGDACVLWCHAIVHAITTGDLNLRVGMHELPEHRQAYWQQIITEAENQTPDAFYSTNGWVVAALQGAWSAIFMGLRANDGLVGMLERAVRGGGDTDTVAAIAGGLVGAAFGASSVPASWRRVLHGWGGPNGEIIDARGIINLGIMAQRQGVLDQRSGWPLADRFEPDHIGTLVTHPHDDKVYLASLDKLDELPADVDAVVSMCRVGNKQIPAAATNGRAVELIEFWLVDREGYNLDPEFVLRDAADTIAALRAEGKTVLLHCWAAQSRTPSAAITYSVTHLGIDLARADREVRDALPSTWRNPELLWALEQIGNS